MSIICTEINIKILLLVSPSRREDFCELQQEMDLDEIFFVRYVESRWLSLLGAVCRIIDRFDALKKYFLSDLPSNKDPAISTERYRRIASKLKSEGLIVQLHFLASIKPVFDKYLRIFQTEGPLIHCLYSSIVDLIKTILYRFLKEDLIKGKTGQDLSKIDPTQTENKIQHEKIDIGKPARQELQKVKSALVKKDCMLSIVKFYETTSKYLLQKMPLQNKLLNALVILQPEKRHSRNGSRFIKTVSEAMPFVQDEDISLISDEWRLYVEDNEDVKSYERIDKYWTDVMNSKNGAGQQKYPHMSKVVMAALSLPHSNADTERSLSMNKRMLGTDRGRLSPDTINGLRACKDSVKAYGGCTKIPITRALLGKAREAHSFYRQKLEDKKKEEKSKQEAAIQAKEEQARKEKEERERAEKLYLSTPITRFHILDSFQWTIKTYNFSARNYKNLYF